MPGAEVFHDQIAAAGETVALPLIQKDIARKDGSRSGIGAAVRQKRVVAQINRGFRSAVQQQNAVSVFIDIGRQEFPRTAFGVIGSVGIGKIEVQIPQSPFRIKQRHAAAEHDCAGSRIGRVGQHDFSRPIGIADDQLPVLAFQQGVHVQGAPAAAQQPLAGGIRAQRRIRAAVMDFRSFQRTDEQGSVGRHVQCFRPVGSEGQHAGGRGINIRQNPGRRNVRSKAQGRQHPLLSHNPLAAPGIAHGGERRPQNRTAFQNLLPAQG